MAKRLREFKQQAAERVRVARQHGFDVAAVEETNARQYEALKRQIIAERVGPLQQLLADIDAGNLG